MHSPTSRVATLIVAGLLIAACAPAASTAPAATTTLSSPTASALVAATSSVTSTPSATPASPPISPAVTAITAGDIHTCLLTSSGGVECWGSNDVGQLGNESTTQSSTPVAVKGLASGVIAISAGGNHTCALTTVGAVKCWGGNVFGELGNGKTVDSSVPVNVSGLTRGVNAITAGGSGTCAIVTDGRVQCWGMGNWGQLGNGASTDSPVPVDVAALAGDVTAIAAGGWHTCALIRGTGVRCWGTDAYWPDCGESPCPDARDERPVPVAGLPSAIAAIAAGGHHTCVLSTGGAVTCWGGARYIAGYNGSGNETGTAGEVEGLASGVVAIAAGGQHTCALMSRGGVKCWGINDNGALGDGSATSTIKPVDVVGLASGVSAIAGGGSHTCALLATGEVTCWGANRRGQLGNNAMDEGSDVPVDVVSTGP